MTHVAAAAAEPRTVQANLLHRQLLDSDRDVWEDAEHKPEACVQQVLEAG